MDVSLGRVFESDTLENFSVRYNVMGFKSSFPSLKYERFKRVEFSGGWGGKKGSQELFRVEGEKREKMTIITHIFPENQKFNIRFGKHASDK